MCTWIAVKGGDIIETCGQLRELVGVENIVFDADMDGHEFADDECLCHVDVQATAARSGFTCDAGYSPDFLADFVLERKTL